MQSRFDIESEKPDKNGGFQSLFGFSLLESTLSHHLHLFQFLIFCLSRREVLMSCFIASFKGAPSSWQSHRSYFRYLIFHLQIFLIQRKSPQVQAEFLEDFYSYNYLSNKIVIWGNLFHLQSKKGKLIRFALFSWNADGNDASFCFKDFFLGYT